VNGERRMADGHALKTCPRHPLRNASTGEIPSARRRPHATQALT
jgi:hypothetical protein